MRLSVIRTTPKIGSKKALKNDLIQVSSCVLASIPSAPIRDSRSLYVALVSIIKLENLGTKARMRLIPGEEFFGVRQFGALRGRITIFEEFCIVASSGPWLLE